MFREIAKEIGKELKKPDNKELAKELKEVKAVWVPLLKYGSVGFIVGWIFVGLPVVGYQVVVYLRSGQWMKLSAIDGFKYFISRDTWSWLWSPQDWIGIHELLESTPLSLFLVLIVSGIVAWIGAMKGAADLDS